VIKDLVTSGALMFKTIELLSVVELKVTDVVVFINRKQKDPNFIEDWITTPCHFQAYIHCRCPNEGWESCGRIHRFHQAIFL
jgi:hypothetical protein